MKKIRKINDKNKDEKKKKVDINDNNNSEVDLNNEGNRVKKIE